MGRRDYSDIVYWKGKIKDLSQKSFHPDVGKWANHILDELTKTSDGRVIGKKPRDLAFALGVPKKYIMRSLALISRPGLVVMNYTDDQNWEVELQRSGNIKKQFSVRKAPSKRERRALLAAELNKCGVCGKTFADNELHIDHIIPLAMRGADHAGNWSALCKACHKPKRANFDREDLQYYRGEKLNKVVGVVAIGQWLWPRINGRIRKQTREQLISA